jgi:hypothetical protein
MLRMNSQRTLEICDPCRSEGDHHMECAGTTERPCACLVCEGERIGDAEVGKPNDPQHSRIVDRYDPRPWRP